MSQTRIVLTADLLTPGAIRLQEVTGVYNAVSNPYGWGYPNPMRSSVSKFIVSVNYAGGRVASWETAGSTTGALATGDFILGAVDLALLLSGCTCQIAGNIGFKSGCLTIGVRAVQAQTISRIPANYTIRLTSNLPDCGRVWVTKEGQWIDITDAGANIDDYWQWQVLSKTDLYENWELRINGISVRNGQVLAQGLAVSPVTATITTTLGQGTLTLFLAGVERQAWSDLVAKWLNSQLGGQGGCGCAGSCSCGTIATYGVPAVADCKKGELAYIGQLLDMLEGKVPNEQFVGIAVDCQTGNVLLKRIQAELRKW